jgi:membrane fusion protein, multidrug efflux system
MESQPTVQKKRNPVRLIIILAVVAVALFFGIRYLIESSHYETTDNAQLDGTIIPIRSSIGGFVTSVKFEDNNTVKKGQLLVTIDDADPKAKQAQAEAALQYAQSNIGALQTTAQASQQNAQATVSNAASLQANIASAQARQTQAQADYDRANNLFKEGATTRAQLDAAQAALDVARAQVTSAQNAYRASTVQSGGAFSQASAQGRQVNLAQALVRQREAELILANTQVAYTQVTSPANGIISKKSVDPGQFISVGSPIASIVDKDDLWVTANFKETQMENIRVGQEVEIELDAYPGLKVTGQVESIGGATGARFSLLPPDNATGNFVKVTQRVPVRIKITGYPKDKAEVLLPGLSTFVRVRVK